jgi:hypothetical protein
LFFVYNAPVFGRLDNDKEMFMIPRTTFQSYVLVTLAIFAAFSPALFAVQEIKPFLGDWAGKISIAGIELDFTLHFTLNSEKAIIGTIDVPAQGAAGISLADIKIEAKTISFTIAGAPGDPLFKGTPDESGQKMTGTLAQSGLEGTFAAEKV